VRLRINGTQVDTYYNYNDLCRNERYGVDYQIKWQNGVTGFCIMAPHGGDIEPGTSEIAKSIAGNDHAFYSFEGMKLSLNAVLHIPSVSFDEPKALWLAQMSKTVITVHGCADQYPSVFIGGLDSILIGNLKESLRRYGFPVQKHPNQNLQGVHPGNLCNLSATGMGVQLELTKGLRSQMLTDLTPLGNKAPTGLFFLLVEAFREALETRESERNRQSDIFRELLS